MKKNTVKDTAIMDTNIKRGQIYFITDDPTILPAGSEIWPNRPAVIVSNNVTNKHSDVVSIVYLTTSKKKDSPTHVPIKSSGKSAIAMCEQVTSISKERLGDYIGECTKEELTNINAAVQFALSISSNNSHLTGIMRKWEYYVNKYHIMKNT